MNIRIPSNADSIDEALTIGTQIGRYVIEEILARGGFGITYLCRHKRLDCLTVVKEHFPVQFARREPRTYRVLPIVGRETDFRWSLERFMDEGKTTSQCRHSNVVGVTDVLSGNGTAYLILGYDRGLKLADWIAGLGRRPSQAELDQIVQPLLDALAQIHSQDLLHRDIAPDNIMVRSDGTPCLIDFGAAKKSTSATDARWTALVKSGYSPPEQYSSSAKSQGAWSDVYALAATVYFALTGSRPPDSVDRKFHDDLTPLTRLLIGENGYRRSFLEAVDWGLQLAPLSRPRSARQWQDAMFRSDPPKVLPPPLPEVRRVADGPRLGLLEMLEAEARDQARRDRSVGASQFNRPPPLPRPGPAVLVRPAAPMQRTGGRGQVHAPGKPPPGRRKHMLGGLPAGPQSRRASPLGPVPIASAMAVGALIVHLLDFTPLKPGASKHEAAVASAVSDRLDGPGRPFAVETVGAARQASADGVTVDLRKVPKPKYCRKGVTAESKAAWRLRRSDAFALLGISPAHAKPASAARARRC